MLRNPRMTGLSYGVSPSEGGAENGLTAVEPGSVVVASLVDVVTGGAASDVGVAVSDFRLTEVSPGRPGVPLAWLAASGALAGTVAETLLRAGMGAASLLASWLPAHQFCANCCLGEAFR